uniref:WAT1-related protein n=1 Tax=Leersia perrieri TaxID=77586 RepID=A0A0D9X7P1_9ORYZ
MDIDGGADKAAAAGGGATAGWKPPASMVLVQLFITGMILLSKVSIGDGIFIFGLLTYCSVIGAAFILPMALISERGKWRLMDWRAFGWIFFNALIGYTVPTLLYYYGLKDTTPSYSVIFLNAGGIQHWKHGWSTKDSGCTGLCRRHHAYHPLQRQVTPSMEFHLATPKRTTYKVYNQSAKGDNFIDREQLHLCLLSKILKVYPYKYWSTMAICLIGGIQSAFVGIILRRDKNAWKLGWNLNLVTIVYTGTVGTAGRYILNSWAIAKRGPIYPPMFNPLSVVFTVVLDTILMGNDVTIGSLIGTAMVIVGLYLFLWAKAREVPRQGLRSTEVVVTSPTNYTISGPSKL